MDDHNPPAPDDTPTEGEAQEDRARIARRDAKLAWRAANPEAAAAEDARWQAENAEQIASYNAWFARDGESYLRDLLGNHPLAAELGD